MFGARFRIRTDLPGSSDGSLFGHQFAPLSDLDQMMHLVPVVIPVHGVGKPAIADIRLMVLVRLLLYQA